MKGVYLINYAVKGIKSIDQWVRLSFYKKTITKDFSTHGYNIKGIYGANGTGKSAIISSVRIMKNLIINESYLNNPVAQKHLDALINKHLGVLEMQADYLVDLEDSFLLYHYHIKLKKDKTAKFCIAEESLKCRNATSITGKNTQIFKVVDGIIIDLLRGDDRFAVMLKDQSKNLLSKASLLPLMLSKTAVSFWDNLLDYPLARKMISLLLFGSSLFVYLDEGDDHTDYIVSSLLDYSEGDNYSIDFPTAMKFRHEIKRPMQFMISDRELNVSKSSYPAFEREVEQLQEFLRIFKKELKSVAIDRKEDKYFYKCRLIMRYQDYDVDAEFESTGIKKLIKLFAFLKKSAEGEIVFIDEMDANLHDVYLCALLEYLMEYGEGQLCFTTHNIGPMDILKKNKKSIDFLSVDHTIYSWTTNGNYSPSKLYKNGMIEGSPFNVDSIDFVGALYSSSDEDDEEQ